MYQRQIQACFLLLFVVLSLTQPGRSFGQRIYVVIATDTFDKTIGESCQVDERLLTYAFYSGVPRNQLHLTKISGNNFSRRDILRAIQNTNPSSHDGLVFVGSCHGGYDRHGHYLVMRNGDRLYRSEIVRHVRQRGAGTDVVMTDSCNVRTAERSDSCFDDASPDRPQSILPLFRALFLDARGLADINSASAGETALCNSAGGFFVQKLCCLLGSNVYQRTSWQDFSRRLNNEVKSLYSRRGGGAVRATDGNHYRTQTLRAWHLPPGWPGNNSQQNPDMLSLTRGDVILSVNGQVIRSRQDCIHAVNNSPHVMQFTVRDSRDGTVWHMETHLRNHPPSRFGVNLSDNNGDGAFVTRVVRGSPATNNRVLGRVR